MGESEWNSGRRRCPLTIRRAEALTISLLQQVQTALSADEDTGKTAVRRLVRQLNMHCIRVENILDMKTEKKKEAPETRVKRTKLGNKTELIEREEPERKQPKTITAEAYLDVLWTYTSAWPEQASRNFKTNPEQPRPMRCRHTTMYNSFE